MKTVAYECPFVPAEWIAAHGVRPSRILPRGREGPPGTRATSIGLCAYARSFAERAASLEGADAVIVTSVCDQLRRIVELPELEMGSPTFLMNVPATWQSTGAQQLYRSELERLGRFLVDLGGTYPAPGELARVMLEYDEKRALLRASRGRLSARGFSEAIARFHEHGEVDEGLAERARPSRGTPLALLGGPLLAEHFVLFDLVEEHGGTIALDATETGERTLPAPFDRRSLAEAPLVHLAEAYFGSIPSAFRRPNDELYRWLAGGFAERGIEGVVFKRYVWCDLWNAEAERLREWTDLPVLAIDTDDQGLDAPLSSRVQALLEVLR